MMKCEIIRDLLPLYCDGLCSEASKQEIETHVAQCGECRACLAEMKEEAPVPPLSHESETEARVLQGVKKKFSRGRRRAVLIAVAVMSASMRERTLAHMSAGEFTGETPFCKKMRLFEYTKKIPP